MSSALFVHLRSLYDNQMWSSITEFASLFAGAAQNPEGPSAASNGLSGRERLAVEAMTAAAYMENKEFTRAEAVLKRILHTKKQLGHVSLLVGEFARRRL